MAARIARVRMADAGVLAWRASSRVPKAGRMLGSITCAILSNLGIGGKLVWFSPVMGFGEGGVGLPQAGLARTCSVLGGSLEARSEPELSSHPFACCRARLPSTRTTTLRGEGGPSARRRRARRKRLCHPGRATTTLSNHPLPRKAAPKSPIPRNQSLVPLQPKPPPLRLQKASAIRVRRRYPLGSHSPGTPTARYQGSPLPSAPRTYG